MIALLLNKGGSLANKPQTALKKNNWLSTKNLQAHAPECHFFPVVQSSSNDRLWDIL